MRAEDDARATGRSRGPVRDLTEAERAAITELLRRQRWIPLTFSIVPLLGAIYLLRTVLTDHGTKGDAVGYFGASLMLGIVAFGLYSAFQPSPVRRPGGRYQRVGRLEGDYYLSGKPVLSKLDGVTLILPPTWIGYFQWGEHADVEITPPLEDDPRLHLPRMVVSAYGGRLRITDPNPPPPNALW